MPAYYRAYRAYMAKKTRDAFDPSTGYRHLHGCYVDRGEFTARLRLLARRLGGAGVNRAARSG